MLALIICIIAIGLMVCLVKNEHTKENQSFSSKEDTEDTNNSSVNNWFVLYCLFDLFK